MKVIFALGNPEIKYAKTRHNVGFMVADRLLSRKGLKISEKFQSFFAKDGDVLYVMPTTYMNLSGRAVVEVMNFYKLSVEDILVVYDDLALPLGTIRFRKGGSDAGHNGIKSIINSLSSKDFDRLKVGIGPQPEGMPSEAFVLQNFSANEADALNKILEISADAVEDYIKNSSDFSLIQSKYNKPWV
ncbi:peptidyl-tRNA hydrolase, PTH1 family [Candidatus Gastranaerophilus sp. (ex Termes propinquus)]|nr:peptidyl-tRNA hydrolase, PTH1 family [Candidatus Gastranaerophilus sp. (ex Termes propinquus)]